MKPKPALEQPIFFEPILKVLGSTTTAITLRKVGLLLTRRHVEMAMLSMPPLNTRCVKNMVASNDDLLMTFIFTFVLSRYFAMISASDVLLMLQLSDSPLMSSTPPMRATARIHLLYV